ncbi:N-acetylglucosamine-6-phosphate deacetylase [Pedobacter cryotolerans]|uniref:N-acetylglucosamine-6-phosphate deacetylase n=1 Tax=Pedobacter cryotolerans TaxID=2571270 RepID=A0A4U1C9W0_9SPHI|nr:N-acetylglucosamine-6-phosphate deacetylase [Pedobacter cryotolerans]TKC03229.1 N-acetylglucosamine-6-phosphate deacetylase [Pedobacter cryotolerans]
MIAITNSRFFKDNELIANQTVLINEGKIVAFTDGTLPNGYEIIDAEQDYLVPGFIELQIYGSGGNLFSAYPSVETLAQMDADLISKGTTSFLACVATNSPEIVRQSIEAAKAYRPKAKSFMGLHLEGPYLNVKRRGAHISKFIKKATLEEVKAVLEHADGVVKMMTIAPELQDDEVIQLLLDNNIVLSMGHSDATFEQATEAYNKGIVTTTHLFNAMPSIHHREPNLPTAFFNHPTALASIIADGSHVNFEAIKLSYKLAKGRLFLITDAVTACNIGPYQHQLVGDKFITPDGTLSGSNITLVDAVRNCVDNCDIPLNDALNMANLIPTQVIGKQDELGKIAIGYAANLIILDQSLKTKEIIFQGKKVNSTFQH